jgi:hypothetical protein
MSGSGTQEQEPAAPADSTAGQIATPLGVVDPGNALQSPLEVEKTNLWQTLRAWVKKWGPLETAEEAAAREKAIAGLWSPTLIEAIYALSKEQLLAEERRDGLISGKATALLGAVGFSLTLSFGFAGLLAKDQVTVPGWVLDFYLVGLLFGVLAGISATSALWVRGSWAIASKDVFNQEVLGKADKWDVKDPKVGEQNESTECGTAYHRRYLIEHFWKIYAMNSGRHNKSAFRVWLGQCFFLVFLVSVMFAGGGLWNTLRARTDKEPANPPAARQVVPSTGASPLARPGSP